MTDARTAAWRPGRPATAAARPPLPVLPLFPGVPDYPALLRAQRDAGFRHAADALFPPAEPATGGYRPTLRGDDRADAGFRILDGLLLPPERGSDLRRVDAAACDAAAERWAVSGDPRVGAAREVLRRLAAAERAEPMAVRRIVLYQLCVLLTDAGGGADAARAVALGVDRSEAGELAAAVAAGFPAAGPVREAAERLLDVRRQRRLRTAAGLAALLPAAPADQRLAALLAELTAELATLTAELAEAERLAAAGEHATATAVALRAARRALDDPAARTLLFTVAAAVAGDGQGRVTAAPTPAGPVVVSWPTPSRPVRCLVVRFPDGVPEEAVALDVPADAGQTVVDPEPLTGRPSRYAVLPLEGDRPAGAALACGPVTVLPEVSGAVGRAVPGGVACAWRAHPAAAAVRAVRADGADVPCGPHGFMERPLPPGEYVYRVSCGYRDPAGDLVWSPGVRVAAVAADWPGPVAGIDARPAGTAGQVRVSWPPPARGESRLVVWRDRAPEPGSDVSDALGRLSAVHGDDTGTVTVLPPLGGALRLTVLSVLGDRAVAGPSVLLERPGAVQEFAVTRVAPDRAVVAFRWPEPAVLVLLAWAGDGDGGRGELRVARSRHRAGPVELPVGPGRCTVTAAPVARPDATLAFGTDVRVELPAVPLPRLALHRAQGVFGPARRTLSDAVRRALRRLTRRA
ncbi:hypothetical protein RM844_10205 [Streptomyces sp. DSM 44915]|uniref:LigA protein n=1 Tax=Streptomyces chisholmiae TaxID=3075540 RepID=A0ABU2JPM0_9ACTN|nr:hypothetical protein [Streptomyces sp. DSM 44915]MDT0266664.1 hypothetical protein [Streptomyces sp. DSM 44915]